MSDCIVRHLRAGSAALRCCPEHTQTMAGDAFVNLHKRADEMSAAANEIERLRTEVVLWRAAATLTPEERETLAIAVERESGTPLGTHLRYLLQRLTSDVPGAEEEK